jgi:hypothetical protein
MSGPKAAAGYRALAADVRRDEARRDDVIILAALGLEAPKQRALLGKLQHRLGLTPIVTLDTSATRDALRNRLEELDTSADREFALSDADYRQALARVVSRGWDAEYQDALAAALSMLISVLVLREKEAATDH